MGVADSVPNNQAYECRLPCYMDTKLSTVLSTAASCPSHQLRCLFQRHIKLMLWSLATFPEPLPCLPLVDPAALSPSRPAWGSKACLSFKAGRSLEMFRVMLSASILVILILGERLHGVRVTWRRSSIFSRNQQAFVLPG